MIPPNRLRTLWTSIGWKWKLYLIGVGIFGYQFVGHYLVPRFMYLGWAVGDGAPERTLEGLHKDWVPHEAGRTEFWYLLGNGVSAREPGPAVLFAHGNRELIDAKAVDLIPYQRAGISVFLCEYRGYGRSTGQPGEAALVADFERVLHFARSLPEVDGSRLIFHGRSLGGAVVAALASFQEPKALILESTFVDAASASRFSLMWPMMIPDRWRSLERLDGYPGATLILHGKRDLVVSPNSASTFHRRIPGSRLLWFDGGGHRLQAHAEDDYWNPIRAFLSELGCWETDHTAAGHEKAGRIVDPPGP